MKFLFHRRVEHGVNAFYATFVVTNCLCCYALKPFRFHLGISVSYETHSFFFVFEGIPREPLKKIAILCESLEKFGGL